MEIKSTDMKADEAVDAIREMTDRDAIVLFIAGDERKTVIHAAEEQAAGVTMIRKRSAGSANCGN